ncbi:hypothetical protein Q3G72_023404 [Acer saccharum]|nr:hypothetical protein Q3G72_023404 [Acer saccharum]
MGLELEPVTSSSIGLSVVTYLCLLTSYMATSGAAAAGGGGPGVAAAAVVRRPSVANSSLRWSSVVDVGRRWSGGGGLALTAVDGGGGLKVAAAVVRRPAVVR